LYNDFDGAQTHRANSTCICCAGIEWWPLLVCFRIVVDETQGDIIDIIEQNSFFKFDTGCVVQLWPLQTLQFFIFKLIGYA
jgi:hypothetical protein